jgi:maltose phosphorylase
MIFGFGGMRTDGDVLSFQPTLPHQWRSYRFRVCYRGAVIEVQVNRTRVQFQVIHGPAVKIQVYGKTYLLDAKGITDFLKVLPPTGTDANSAEYGF